MNVDHDLIIKVAGLSRIKLTDEEVKEFTPQLKEVLEFFTVLDKINTDDVEPSFHPIEIKNALRDDTPGKCLNQEEALENTEHKNDGFFRGPGAV
ncbi:Asp-tRNA(Asn)/Glu-tRNA(Gln) amidotransferase subunit GatC [Candidatus Woesearchaeota archaeon]|nr:Asp-tRNA(Asn)/Glu-tRNA(Gln) amidotransferase subunit GatC [Candidatus Woesearchaeota archaeon]